MQCTAKKYGERRSEGTSATMVEVTKIGVKPFAVGVLIAPVRLEFRGGPQDATSPLRRFASFARAPADNVVMSTANLPNTTTLTQTLSSATPSGVRGRIGKWFRKGPVLARSFWPGRGNIASLDSTGDLPAVTGEGLFDENEPEPPPRLTFLRNRAPRNSPVEVLESGLSTLADLMAGIRVGLEAQSRRQEDLARCLANLPELVQQLPENHRLQLEALGAVGQQMERHNAQQSELADVLERMNQADVEKGRALDALCGHEAAIGHNLSQVGAVMQSVSATSEAGTRVLEMLQKNIERHDSEMERAIHRQSKRLTALLVVAFSLSAAALGSVAVMGWLVIHRH